MTFVQSLRKLIKDQRGAAMPEYALLLGLIAAVAVVTLTSMGTNINSIFTTVNGKLATAASR